VKPLALYSTTISNTLLRLGAQQRPPRPNADEAGIALQGIGNLVQMKQERFSPCRVNELGDTKSKVCVHKKNKKKEKKLHA
jgi:hypothetical protein